MTAAYVASLPALALVGLRYVEAHPVAYVLAMLAPSAAFVLIVWRTSERPWRWRNGEDD